MDGRCLLQPFKGRDDAFRGDIRDACRYGTDVAFNAVAVIGQVCTMGIANVMQGDKELRHRKHSGKQDDPQAIAVSSMDWS